MRDFSVNVYRNLIEAFKSDYLVKTFHQYISEGDSIEKFVVLRHDVDKRPEYSLNIARLESRLGISSTYYFKYHPSIFIPSIIREISDLGHEIGYHYEDLAICKGDAKKAIERFKHNLEKFRETVQVKTICADGSPLSIYDNRSLWDKFDYREYGILGEPYFDIDYSEFLYLTDTGRIWNGEKYNIRDKTNGKFNYAYKSTFDIIKDLKKGSLPDKIHMTTHPQRWTDKPLPWLRELVMQNVKNVAKRMLIAGRGK